MDQTVFDYLWHIVSTFSGMVWQIYWPLAFGLMLSSLLRHLLPVDKVAQHLGHTSPKSLALTTLLGMLSSSCSYAAASLSKTLIAKKASLSNAMAFLVASTNLILEMFIVLVTLLGWQFLWGEIAGGILLIILVAILFQFFPKKQETALRNKLEVESSPMLMAHHHMDSQPDSSAAQTQGSTQKESMEMQCGMADMDQGERKEMTCSQQADAETKPMQCGSHDTASKEMTCGMSESGEMRCGMAAGAPTEKESFSEKISRSSGYFQMDIAMIGKEILIGVVISSLLIALIPADWWRQLFISSGNAMPAIVHSLLDVVIGIFVAVIAYVCSVGNLLLAAALWHGGISFGGVMGFILADVLTIPMTRVYRSYYGKQPAHWMVGLLFIGILLTGILLDLTLGQMDWSASKETLRTLHQSGFGLNFTTVMNLIFIPLSVWYYRLGKKTNAASGMSM
ncbi:permease [Shewanella submarina]|uniref:Permease n=1 Tax=Shewanella submarina TaxID=2016376 RepID=A0ABV7G9R4_9GAMM|nr:permease [Shewanella submarina]MCL1037151.1 permease [Shewanella submarina]